MTHRCLWFHSQFFVAKLWTELHEQGRGGRQGTPSTDYSWETGISTWHQALSLLRAELLTRYTTPVVTPPPLKIKGKAFGCFWYLKSQLYQCLPMHCNGVLQRHTECRFKGTNLSNWQCQCAERFCVKNSATLSLICARPACGNCCIGTYSYHIFILCCLVFLELCLLRLLRHLCGLPWVLNNIDARKVIQW